MTFQITQTRARGSYASPALLRCVPDPVFHMSVAFTVSGAPGIEQGAGSADVPHASHRPEVLLVEDNADDAELSLRALSKSGLAPDAKWVRDGTEAMEWLDAGGLGSLRLILLDLKMPRMDGYEVLGRLKRDPRTRDVPVIVMVSAHGVPELTQCFALGADSYLVKPLEPDALLHAAQSLGLSLR